MIFSFERDECRVLYNGETIVIREDEVERINHHLFPEITVIEPPEDHKRFRFMSSSDIAIRLSLAFKGDVVTIVRPVLFVGGGIQSEPMGFRIE